MSTGRHVAIIGAGAVGVISAIEALREGHRVTLIDAGERVVALIVQVLAYYVARIPMRDLSRRIAAGEMGPAIWLGCVSVTGGLINAASMGL